MVEHEVQRVQVSTCRLVAVSGLSLRAEKSVDICAKIMSWLLVDACLNYSFPTLLLPQPLTHSSDVLLTMNPIIATTCSTSTVSRHSLARLSPRPPPSGPKSGTLRHSMNARYIHPPLSFTTPIDTRARRKCDRESAINATAGSTWKASSRAKPKSGRYTGGSTRGRVTKATHYQAIRIRTCTTRCTPRLSSRRRLPLPCRRLCVMQNRHQLTRQLRARLSRLTHRTCP